MNYWRHRRGTRHCAPHMAHCHTDSAPGMMWERASVRRGQAHPHSSRATTRQKHRLQGLDTLARASPPQSTAACGRAAARSRWGQWCRRARPKPAVLLVDCRADGRERLAFRLHGHHGMRDVETDVSGGAMAGEGDAPPGKPLRHITIGIVAVADSRTATKAGDVLEGCPVGCSIAVRLLDLRVARSGKGR